jgi:ribonuclease HI
MGVGLVVRNVFGEVVVALAATIPCIYDPTMAEAMGAWRATSFNCEKGLSQVVFEGDSLLVVTAVKKEEPCWSDYGQLVEDTKSLLSSFSFVEFQHIRRDANQAAHHMAKMALSLPFEQLWMGNK